MDDTPWTIILAEVWIKPAAHDNFIFEYQNSKWNYKIVIFHCEGNLASTISYLFAMYALLNTRLPFVLQIGC